MARLVRNGNGPTFQSTAPEWMEQLLLRERLGPVRLTDEDRHCIAFGDRLREAALLGRLRATFTHIPHEVGGGTTNAGLRYSLAKALGLITGSADYVFVWSGGGGWIEFKRPAAPGKPAGRLSVPQRQFGEWCQRQNVNWRVAHTANEGFDILREWGVID
jgi:hypothetical protein